MTAHAKTPADKSATKEEPAKKDAGSVQDQLASINAKLDLLLQREGASPTTTPPSVPVDTNVPSPISNVNPNAVGGMRGEPAVARH